MMLTQSGFWGCKGEAKPVQQWTVHEEYRLLRLDSSSFQGVSSHHPFIQPQQIAVTVIKGTALDQTLWFCHPVWLSSPSYGRGHWGFLEARWPPRPSSQPVNGMQGCSHSFLFDLGTYFHPACPAACCRSSPPWNPRENQCCSPERHVTLAPLCSGEAETRGRWCQDFGGGEAYCSCQEGGLA